MFLEDCSLTVYPRETHCPQCCFYHEFHFVQPWQRNPMTSIRVVFIPLNQESKFDLESGVGQVVTGGPKTSAPEKSDSF